MGFDALVSFTYLNRIYRKSNICMPALNIEQNSGYVSQSNLIPYFSACALLSYCLLHGVGCVLSKSPFLLEDKQETKFGGVMSAQSTHIILASVFHFHVDFMIII